MLEYTPWLSWLFPILGAVLTPLLAVVHPKVRDYGAVVFTALGAVSALLIFQGYPEVLSGERYAGVYPLSLEWISVAGVTVNAGMLIDPLSVSLAVLVAWLSLLIMIYSLGYMHEDPSLTRYWFFMNLFVGSMMLLVLSDNFIQFLFGWEGVGLCSYALIGFYHRDSPNDRRTVWVGEGAEEYPPSHTGMKAFLMTRAGDVLLLAAIFLIYAEAGTFNFVELEENLSWAGGLAGLGLLIPAALLLLGGPMGKSAQLPFMEWLPDAMTGPASVSALIHAATMVKAGVYLVARVFPIFYLAMHSGHPDLLGFFQAVAWIGALTAFMAATQAVVSTELKKVWAYSTLSQIGYMMLALGIAGFLTGDAVVAAFTAALFHLISHAVFKAALFLSSGATIHSCESKYMTDMGGLRRLMPITFASMLIASLALAGIPPLSGFWSKELVLRGVVEAFSFSGQSYLLYILATATVGITFFYSLRAVGMVFLGGKSRHLEEEEKHGHHVHEVSPTMWVPYAALALASIAIGIAAPIFFESALEGFYHTLALPEGLHLEALGAHHSSLGEWLVPLTSALLLALGGIPAYYAYIKGKLNTRLLVIEKPYLAALQAFLFKRWYINRLYYKALVDSSLGLGNLTYSVGESRGLQGFNRLVVRGVAFSYNQLRRIHTGAFNDYALGLMVAMVVMIIMVVWLSLAW